MATKSQTTDLFAHEEVELISKRRGGFKVTSTIKNAGRRLFHDSWYGELGASLLSSASLVAIVIIAHLYDGQPVPALFRGLTLNAIISILATTLKAALLFCTASCLGQWKWLWYRRGRNVRLSALQTFDDATRGPWGALQLFMTSAWSSIAVVGAILVLLATVIDPFIQQVLSYQSETSYRSSNLTWTNAARHYSPGPTSRSQTEPIPVPELDPVLTQAVYEDAVASNSTAPFARRPVCASTNCTWERFSSLGICAKCADISKQTVLTNCSIKPESFPDWSYLDDTSMSNISFLTKTCNISIEPELIVPVSLDAYRVLEGEADDIWGIYLAQYLIEVVYGEYPTRGYRDEHGFFIPTYKNILGIQDPLATLAAVNVSVNEHGMAEVISAHLCTLDFCVLQFDVNVTDGISQIITSQTEYGTKFNISNGDQCWTLAKPPFNGTAFIELEVPPPEAVQESPDTTEPSNGNAAWLYSGPSLLGSQNYAFCYEMSGNTSGGGTGLASYLWGPNYGDLGGSNNLTGGYFCQGLECNTSVNPFTSEYESWSSPDIRRINAIGFVPFIENLEASLTKFILDSTGQKVFGKAGVSVTLVRVRWKWLILPACLEVLGLLFLFATMWATHQRKIPLWKASLWPVLLMDVGGLVQTTALPDNSVANMSDAMDEANVRLMWHADGKLGLGK